MAQSSTDRVPGASRIPSRPLNRPSIELAVEFNRVVREDDEWFEEPDALDRVMQALRAIELVEEPVEAAAVLAFTVARAQGFAEGNKRTPCC